MAAYWLHKIAHIAYATLTSNAASFMYIRGLLALALPWSYCCSLYDTSSVTPSSITSPTTDTGGCWAALTSGVLFVGCVVCIICTAQVMDSGSPVVLAVCNLPVTEVVSF